MKRSPQLIIAAIASLVFYAPSKSCGADGADKTKRPNVLFIMIDDLRPSLGCYGDSFAISPNIDEFASTARVFRRAYCHQSVCGPSRASILTGQLPDHTRVWNNRHHFRTSQPNLITLPELFKKNGYHVQGLGKIFSGDEREEDPQSWTVPSLIRQEGWKNYLLPENRGKGKQGPYEFSDVADTDFPDGKLAEVAVHTLEQLNQQQQPFFLAVGFFKPHLPFNAPQKYWDLYSPARFKKFPSLDRPEGAPESAYPDHLELAGYRGIPKDEQVSTKQARNLRHAYYACISYTDVQVGKVLNKLSALGLDKNTIVVLIGDHGYSLGEANHWCKDTNFEFDTHVPLIVRAPALPQPGVPSDSLVEYVDVYPTVAALAGLTSSSPLDGESRFAILQDPKAEGREAVLSQFPRPFKATPPEVMGYSIRTATQRYTRWIDWTTRQTITEEVYDYTNPESVLFTEGHFIERKSLTRDPGFAEQADQLRRKMDDVLSHRLHRAVRD